MSHVFKAVSSQQSVSDSANAVICSSTNSLRNRNIYDFTLDTVRKNNFVVQFGEKKERTCVVVETLGAGIVPTVELAGGLSLEPRTRFISCVWQTSATAV